MSRLRSRTRVVDGHYIGDTAPSSRVVPGGMFVDLAQIPTDLKEPSMDAGQSASPPVACSLLASVAAALTACESAGVAVRLKHGAVMTREGYVLPLGDGRWVARTLAWTEFSTAMEADDDD